MLNLEFIQNSWVFSKIQYDYCIAAVAWRRLSYMHFGLFIFLEIWSLDLILSAYMNIFLNDHLKSKNRILSRKFWENYSQRMEIFPKLGVMS